MIQKYTELQLTLETETITIRGPLIKIQEDIIINIVYENDIKYIDNLSKPYRVDNETNIDKIGMV